MTYHNLRMSTTDWVLVGYLAGILLYYAVDTMTADAPTSSTSWTDQERTLTEDHLRRLEDGETVTLRRWHGHDLVLAGTVVVDVEEVDE